MIDRSLFQDTFSKLHASEESIQEVLSMTEHRTAKTPRRFNRAVLLTAAVIASLCVGMGVANAATDGALAEAIELRISETLQINSYKTALETEEGRSMTVLGANVDFVKEDGRVLLTIGEETIDITEDLARDNAYTYENTDGDTTLRLEVTPDADHPGEWQCSTFFSDPSLGDEDPVSYTVFTYSASDAYDISTDFKVITETGENGDTQTTAEVTIRDAGTSSGE